MGCEDSLSSRQHTANQVGAKLSRMRAADGSENTPPEREFARSANVKALVQKFDAGEKASPMVDYRPTVNVKTLVQKFDRQSGGEGGRERLAAARRPSAHMRRSISRSPMRGLLATEQSHRMLP